ncbi:MAG: hypothetical protein A3F72_02185 [Bacteroidetes bacterium RIFCSPLOWO2_12_FULL_35_15]|nr:MAG: hypothetical protein A3F72_02185 [Bacteroidetes bacterium RIFCSPLOWO2_12_FULL_35_15]
MAQQLTKGEYFYDTDPGTGLGTAISITQGDSAVFTSSVITTGLSLGFHTLFTRYCDTNGIWGLYEGRPIYIKGAATSTSAQITKAEGFYDSDPGIGNGIPLTVTTGDSVVANLSVTSSGLSSGFHHLFIRFRDADSKWSLYEGRTIFVNSAASAIATQITAAEAFFDTDPGIGLGAPIAATTGDSVVANLNIPTTGISQGFHNLFIRFKDLSNKWSLYEGRTVYVADAIQIAATLVKAEAFFDTDPGIGNGFQISFSPADSLIYTSAIPTTGLSQGIHNLFTRVKDANGKWSLYEGREIVVCNQGPSAAYSFTASGNQVTFTNTSSSDAYAYNWNFGDGASSAIVAPVHNYANAGTFNACLIATSGCGSDTICQTVSFNCTTPTANFTSSINNLNVAFTNTSSGGNSYSWNFGDGATSTQAIPSHTFQNTGTYNVCLVATNGCGTNQKCNPVSVTCAIPTALFSRTINGQTVTFTNSSSNAAGILWDFGDGQTSTQYNEVHQYVNAGSFNVKLKVTNGCGSDSLIYIVDVNCTRPTLAYNSFTDGLIAEFENNTVNGTSYLWKFGDNTQSTLKNPTHIFAATGIYTVCLIGTNSCGSDSICQTISVCTSPTANFTSATSGTTVNFTNTSSNGASSYWTYGNGYATNQVSPGYNYPASGTYNVCLNVSNDCGSDTLCKSVTTFCSTIMNQEICLVTVDTMSTHTIIYWEKPAVLDIDSFRVYREVTTGVYSHLGSVHYDSLSEYHDYGADPNVTSYKYKLTVIDSCGNESGATDWSNFHSTIHLQNLGNGNLQWTLYDIENAGNPVTYYRVYRDDNNTGNFLPISSTIPGGNSTFTDVNSALYSNANYRVDVAWSISCTPTRVSVNTTRSNIKHTSMVTGINSQEGLDATIIYPNPANEYVNIELPESIQNATIRIMNSIGQIIVEQTVISSGNSKTIKQINTSTFAKGIYTIVIESNTAKTFKKLVIN